MVEEWNLYSEDSYYMSLDGYNNCYEQAYQEEYDKAQEIADTINMIIGEFGGIVDPEELMDMDAIDEKAYKYACDLAQAWYDGSEWIPEEIMDWAWYDLSDHNL